MNRVVVIGGYGAVGREAATALTRLLPGATVVVAGRHPDRARPVPGTEALRLDASDPADVARAVAGADAVLMCVDRDNPRVARTCLEGGVHYLDVSADHRLLSAVRALDGLARERGAAALLSVGLVPGVTNLLAKHCVARSGAREVRVGVLLGAGEEHGPAALDWTLDGLAGPPGSWREDFPPPHGRRTVRRFPFSDQYTLPDTLGIEDARTGLCLDSRAATALLAAGGRPAVARLLRHPRIRGVLLAVLGGLHVGGDGFAVTAVAGTARAAFGGHRQSRATGLAAALLARRLPDLPAGVRHVEQAVDPVEFLTELAAHGFTLDLGE
ncbi:saccharopine dehydrogenase NADP-binding domain-containing protein [Thermobifida halotolerans]|uniref:Saccharopine dehydrogenase NADP-binding domain-containing protein n=1 Tax=Thermobifida halotolerans TaxID=483545 RepID=A0AA97M5J1_9ACTN|nr:saccharopine dehydrogenase NADP-binding domain-containing protein [Thermobifida halotolerans]UOE21191.1 saccharopine dehydrogenase NADP-binding domain-containing protein [Thermobifida halotolerans]